MPNFLPLRQKDRRLSGTGRIQHMIDVRISSRSRRDSPAGHSLGSPYTPPACFACRNATLTTKEERNHKLQHHEKEEKCGRHWRDISVGSLFRRQRIKEKNQDYLIILTLRI